MNETDPYGVDKIKPFVVAEQLFTNDRFVMAIHIGFKEQPCPRAQECVQVLVKAP